MRHATKIAATNAVRSAYGADCAVTVVGVNREVRLVPHPLFVALMLFTPVAPTAPPGPRAIGLPADTAAYRIDVGHSDITFRIRHMVSRVTGTFNEWAGTITTDSAGWDRAAVDVTIQAASVDTRHERRDNDLRSANFFDATRHPTITFRSRAVEARGRQLTITGDLAIRGVTRVVVLEGEYLGSTGGGPRERLGFSATAMINRVDFGVAWNRALEGGGMLLGDDVEITINIEAVRM